MKRFEELKLEVISFLRDFLGVKLPDFASINNEVSIYNNKAFDQFYFQIIPRTEYLNNHIRVVVGTHALKIQTEAVNAVVGVLENYSIKELSKLADVINNCRDSSVTLEPFVPETIVEGEGLYYDDGSLGVNYTKVDSRFEGLKKFIYAEFEYISLRLREAATLYCGDAAKIKTDDIVLRLNTRLPGADTEFFFTVSRIPHTFDPTKPIEPTMTPITEEDKLELFNYPSTTPDKAAVEITIGNEIDAAIDRINARVNDFANCNEAVLYPICNDQVISLINGILIPTVVTIQLQPFSTFGGTYEQLMSENGNTRNSEACLAVIDTVLGDLWKTLDAVEAENDNLNISYFAIDIDSCGIYGMDEQGRPVHTIVSGPYTFRHAIERHHTASFIEIFKRYLKTVKNKRVFTHKGEIDWTSIRTKPIKRDVSDVNFIGAETSGDKAVYGNSLKETIGVIELDKELPANN